MKKADFKINEHFYCGRQKWRCTDIGTRTIAAICINRDDENWFAGPPYAVTELVFDENDFKACELETVESDYEFTASSLKEFSK